MKHIKYFIFVFLMLTMKFSLFAEVKHYNSEKITNENSISEYDIQLSKAQTVYICTGLYAYAYHSRSDCQGLKNCKGQINYTDEYSAVNSFDRRPCCRCWSNVSGNCKDDNPNGGGSVGSDNNSEAYAYLALAIVTTSAIILSNDFYIYPAYSFYKGVDKNNYYGQQPNNGNGTGWIFGFRKTFKHSALEYGASYLKFENAYFYKNTIIQNRRWGGHFNFVHQIFYNNTPEWLKVYIGPSLNYVYDFGYGGIIGSEMKLFDRLRLDVRYEWTTQTNQIQAGLIFTYQKKYFWQKNK
jgi:hypothetical protein